MRFLRFSLLIALANAAVDTGYIPSLRGSPDAADGEEADWFHRMAQDTGSMVPTLAPVVSPPGGGPLTPPPSPSPSAFGGPETVAPTKAPPTPPPTPNPTPFPTPPPTFPPTPPPTKAPTASPTTSFQPTPVASDRPSQVPTEFLSDAPSTQPSIAPLFLNFVQENADSDFFFGPCEGDCDTDADCELGLVCFQRDAGVANVPGCVGNANLINNGNEDYCIFPQTDDRLVIRGDDDDNGVKFGTFPLGLCEGDCDSVPGCIGSGGRGFDYCISDFTPLEEEEGGDEKTSPLLPPSRTYDGVGEEEAKEETKEESPFEKFLFSTEQGF
eukprot:scaffold2155_cov96-Cylindrotheca_fusiformis.AAC.4